MIFARKVTPALTSLVKKLDAATAKNRMGSFVVFCSDDEGLEEQLKALAKKEGIKNTVLTVDSPAGPRGYNIAKEAEVTAVLYVKKKVQANHAFGKGEFNEKGVEKIVKDLPKILN